MANNHRIVKNIHQLKLVAGFEDGDDRTIALDNPTAGLSAADIKGMDTEAALCLIGDKAASTFTGWKSAKIVQQTTRIVDTSELGISWS